MPRPGRDRSNGAATQEASAPAPRRVRVVIVDDHVLFAESLQLLLSEDERIEVVGCARGGEEAVPLVEAVEPDVVLMDIAMPGTDGIEATRRIRAASPRTHVLILTGIDASKEIERARGAGASGFLTKKQGAFELTEAIIETSLLAVAFGAPAA
jgi:two-component system response regulator DesR